MTRITVINPNTSAELTATITAAAQAVAGAGVTITGVQPAVGVPSVESHADDAFAEAAREAISADRAEAVVLGCAGLADLVDPLTEKLGVPVVDGVAAAVGIAAGLVAMGLNTSRANTFAPAELERP
ncbi:MAG TPA: aspartate/glutamate racemase family protein [Mycobacterium sp.]|nr:aspartate/glutamate racemase family protein [Mycobacterium sp.]